jgi:hypothetical protein
VPARRQRGEVHLGMNPIVAKENGS